MPSRPTFLASLAALPFLGKLFPLHSDNGKPVRTPKWYETEYFFSCSQSGDNWCSGGGRWRAVYDDGTFGEWQFIRRTVPKFSEIDTFVPDA